MKVLRQRDEEEIRRKQQGALKRIEQHLTQNGGDLSYLLNQQRVPTEVRSVQLTGFGLGKNINIAKVHIPLPLKHEVLIRAHSWLVSNFPINVGFLINFIVLFQRN